MSSKSSINTKADKKAIFRYLRKGGYGFPIVFFIIVILFTALAVKLFISAFLSYVLDNKVFSEYRSIQYLAEVYEKGISREDNEVVQIIDKDNRSYLVTDEDGNIIDRNGMNTRGDVKGLITIAGRKDPVEAYVDTSLPGVVPVDKDGELELAQYIVNAWKKDFFNKSSEEESNSEGTLIYFNEETYEFEVDDNISYRIETEGISVPIWLRVDIKDGTEQFYGKAAIKLNVKDGMFLILFIIAISIIVMAVVVMMITRLFSAISTRRKLWYLFFLNPVTKEKNWMYFVFRGEPIVRKKKFAGTNFAVLDVVFVKYRNFCVCHSVEEGEELLRKVNQLLSNTLKKQELCVHYASANFACLYTYENDEQLKNRLELLTKELEHVDGESYHLKFHIGVSSLPAVIEDGKPVRRKGISLEKEYNNACAARATLSDNDDSGLAFFDEKLVEEQKWIDTVRQNQEKALENEEFVVYYQPKYDPRTNKLRGAEALIRWDSPEFGFKSPGTIIPIFEKNGFITEIDHYMIRHVAKDQKKWLDAGYNCVPVSVNVSRAHFIESDLAEQIRDDVDKYGAPHELIEIELTESAFFDDKKAIVETIKKLKEFGFAVSMDDFGSGYSSLNSLKDMPLDVLKLDADFFRGEAEGGRGEIVVSEAIKLAKSLNMKTVAEGVEIKDQVAFLANQGCDMIQGFYFAKPMPADKYVEKMKSGIAEEDTEEEETTEVVEEVAEETTEVVEEIAEETTEVVEEIAEETTEVVEEVAEATEEVKGSGEETPENDIEEKVEEA
ncbi:MAG: GGDEF domain-containing protein [Lachnospiraceae bacterium]|nr:GGDEF domain-containing protein [Lachnospiraceae bacterium]